MLKEKWVQVCLLGLVFLLSGCGSQGVDIGQPNQTPVEITKLVTVIVVGTETPESNSTATNQIFPASTIEDHAWIASDQAINYVGQNIQVRLESAHCSYQVTVNGSPTFCNDRPYPNHNFTFLVWGEDWSTLDQTCVVVQGLVELYQGKPQIEVSALEQVANCEDIPDQE